MGMANYRDVHDHNRRVYIDGNDVDAVDRHVTVDESYVHGHVDGRGIDD